MELQVIFRPGESFRNLSVFYHGWLGNSFQDTKWENVNKNGKWGTLFSSTFLTILRFKLWLVENPGIGMSWHQGDQSSVNGELVNWAFKAHIFHFWNCIYKVHLPRILCFIHSLWNWPVPSLLQEMRHYYSDQVTS